MNLVLETFNVWIIEPWVTMISGKRSLGSKIGNGRGGRRRLHRSQLPSATPVAVAPKTSVAPLLKFPNNAMKPGVAREAIKTQALKLFVSPWKRLDASTSTRVKTIPFSRANLRLCFGLLVAASLFSPSKEKPFSLGGEGTATQRLFVLTLMLASLVKNRQHEKEPEIVS